MIAGDVVKAEAEVVGIDKKTRTLTLAGEDGNVFDVVVGKEAKNFKQIKVGRPRDRRAHGSAHHATEKGRRPARNGREGHRRDGKAGPETRRGPRDARSTSSPT
jgi:hypothetical protein